MPHIYPEQKSVDEHIICDYQNVIKVKGNNMLICFPLASQRLFDDLRRELCLKFSDVKLEITSECLLVSVRITNNSSVRINYRRIKCIYQTILLRTNTEGLVKGIACFSEVSAKISCSDDSVLKSQTKYCIWGKTLPTDRTFIFFRFDFFDKECFILGKQFLQVTF